MYLSQTRLSLSSYHFCVVWIWFHMLLHSSFPTYDSLSPTFLRLIELSWWEMRSIIHTAGSLWGRNNNNNVVQVVGGSSSEVGSHLTLVSLFYALWNSSCRFVSFVVAPSSPQSVHLFLLLGASFLCWIDMLNHKKMEHLSQFHLLHLQVFLTQKFKGDKSVYDNVRRIFADDAISSLMSHQRDSFVKCTTSISSECGRPKANAPHHVVVGLGSPELGHHWHIARRSVQVWS